MVGTEIVFRGELDGFDKLELLATGALVGCADVDEVGPVEAASTGAVRGRFSAMTSMLDEAGAASGVLDRDFQYAKPSMRQKTTAVVNAAGTTKWFFLVRRLVNRLLATGAFVALSTFVTRGID